METSELAGILNTLLCNRLYVLWIQVLWIERFVATLAGIKRIIAALFARHDILCD